MSESHDLSASRVAILGCGGLGSNVASMLVRAGVGSLTLVDFDRVELGNLNRQLYFRDELGQMKTDALSHTLWRIDPNVALRLETVCICPENLLELVRGADVIVEAVDGAEAKAMIMNECLARLPDVPLVAASGLAGLGSANAVVTRRMAENLYVVGDLTSDVRDGLPLFASRVMIAAAHEAHAVIRVLMGYPEL
ncbi:MAG: sulfur carrier protein ThiS adenylyltransferase ThiF [Actinomycetia bacterium]|nr:sulfur carrier protein ThiS adenylyltransferase ThiF [Actinomycetes bacterium]